MFSMVWKQKTGQDHVDIIMFYNEIFIPMVKPLLVELAPTGVAKTSNQVSETNNNDEGNMFVSVNLRLALDSYSLMTCLTDNF